MFNRLFHFEFYEYKMFVIGAAASYVWWYQKHLSLQTAVWMFCFSLTAKRQIGPTWYRVGCQLLGKSKYIHLQVFFLHRWDSVQEVLDQSANISRTLRFLGGRLEGNDGILIFIHRSTDIRILFPKNNSTKCRVNWIVNWKTCDFS